MLLSSAREPCEHLEIAIHRVGLHPPNRHECSLGAAVVEVLGTVVSLLVIVAIPATVLFVLFKSRKTGEKEHASRLEGWSAFASQSGLQVSNDPASREPMLSG